MENAVEGLILPEELCRLISTGHWPRSEREANRQNLRDPPVPRSLVKQIVPGETQLYLYWPPFRTVAHRYNHGEHEFWDEFGAVHEISPERTLLIADFGLGSDAPIVLDYREPGPPLVLRLQWGEPPDGNHWVRFFATFDEFARSFKLAEAEWR